MKTLSLIHKHRSLNIDISGDKLLTSALCEKLVKDEASEKRFMLSIYQQQKEQLIEQGY